MSDTATTGPRIVVGTDGSPRSIVALQRASELANSQGAILDVVTSWNYPALMSAYDLVFSPSFKEIAETEQAKALEAAFGSHVPKWVAPRVVEGNPAQQLIKASEGATLLVVGSRGHGGFAGLLLGSVSAECAAHAKCDVLIVRNEQA